MKIELLQAGKRFNREWIFRNATTTFNSGFSYAITGPNGSGKSTLLQCLGGMLRLSEGSIRHTVHHQPLEELQTFRHVSFCAPYLELIEEMSLIEFLDFHRSFKPLVNGFKAQEVVRIIGLEKAADKQIRFFSSGMKQRVKLAQALLSDTPGIFLDEPCTNLDAAGIDLYHALIRQYGGNRLIIVSSNDAVEYSFCQERLNMQDFKEVGR